MGAITEFVELYMKNCELGWELDSPKIRELYKGFEIIAIERQNGINNRQGDNRLNKVFKELLIANYPIREIHERQTD